MPNPPILEPAQDQPLPQILDIQHDTDPAQDHGPARRIPHLGHALLFFALAAFAVTLCSVAVLGASHITTEEGVRAHPGLSLTAEGAGYILTLIAAAFIFPALWSKSFLAGIEWNFLAVARRWWWLIPAAVLVSFGAQFADHFVPNPPDNLIVQIMSTTRGAWFVTAFGVILAPLTEEIAFRGFLLPALATAYDWLALDRTPAGLQRWQSSTAHSTYALCFGAIFSSVPFALMHAGQLEHNWAAVAVLFAVSLILSAVRIRNHSVAASVLFHSIYNLTVFVAVIIQTGGYRHLEHLNM